MGSNDNIYWQDVLISLRQIIRATDLHSKKIMKLSGLTIPQVVILRAIDDLGAVTVKALSDHISLSQATVTTILKRLELRGLVQRNRSENDKRAVHAALTSKGQEALENAPSLLHESFVNRFTALEKWEQTQILSTLQKVAKMMEAEDLDASPLLDVGPPDKLD
ncbi:MAG: MarR family transcriptional regulator [Alphaproteobacteria bacterium]|nr:MarR family transcriptional regulator [Rhodospirillales bacterium]MCW9044868.1 MarR family transcriptional regulator [Alphaproteobacteria bacterium]